MVELPEANVLARQLNETIVGKTIENAVANHSPHGFAWYTGDPKEYGAKLTGRKITSSNPGTGYTCGGNIEIIADDMLIVVSTPVKYHAPGAKRPPKHQLMVEFTDGSAITCTVQMWGCMFCFPRTENGLPANFTVNRTPSPLSDAFDEQYFASLLTDAAKGLSAKAFLATEQRIPGLGNGVLQDILWTAKIHPKRKMNTLSDDAFHTVYRAVKDVLAEMTSCGGRDTEKDLFGNPGGYQQVLSKKHNGMPCPACGQPILRSAYLGGNIYVCEGCQGKL